MGSWCTAPDHPGRSPSQCGVPRPLRLGWVRLAVGSTWSAPHPRSLGDLSVPSVIVSHFSALLGCVFLIREMSEKMATKIQAWPRKSVSPAAMQKRWICSGRKNGDRNTIFRVFKARKNFWVLHWQQLRGCGCSCGQT